MDALVLAIASDEKTVTRRLGPLRFAVGDILDVCEALVVNADHVVTYRCDYTPALVDGAEVGWDWKVRVLPARYCPAWAVRHRILVEAVTRETLSCITDADAGREGIARMGHPPTADAFLRAFREIHDLAPDADPELGRIAFRRVRP